MTQIEFHTLTDPAPEALLDRVAALVSDAYDAGRRVHVHAADQDQAHALDELLWTRDPSSFLPHNLIGEGPKPPPPIQIGWDALEPYHHDLLITLASDVPVAWFSRFQQVMEFIPVEETQKQKARDRYRFYRDRGYPLRVVNDSP